MAAAGLNSVLLSPTEELLGGIDQIGDAFILIAGCQTVVAFNAAASRMFGYTEVEVVGHPLDILLPDGASIRHRQHVADFAAGDETDGPMSSLRTVKGRRQSGEEFPVEITVGKRWIEGRLLLTAVIRDVSDARRHEESQRASIEQLSTALRYADEGVIVTDELFTILYVSPFVEKLQGTLNDEMVGRSVAEYVHPDDVRRSLAEFERARADGQSVMSHEVRLRTDGDEWIWVEATTSLELDPAIGGLVTNFRDITGQLAARARREAVAEFGLWALRAVSVGELMQRAADVALEHLAGDAATVFERVSASDDQVVARAWAGWLQSLVGTVAPAPADSPLGKAFTDGNHYLVDDYVVEPWFPGKEAIDASGIRSSLGAIITADGVAWGALRVISARPGDFDESDIAFVRAIANVVGAALERYHSETARIEQGLHDSLTGLPNRELLADRLEVALAAIEPRADRHAAVLVIDVDNFRQINDALGHEVGDGLLREIGRRLTDQVHGNEIVSRIGGDEFVIASITPDSTSHTALADRILASFHRPYQVADRELYVTVSVGMATTASGGTSALTLLQDAEVAMREAKRSGRDCMVMYDGRMRAPLVLRSQLEQDLRHALERDQLLLHYQPVVNSDTGQKAGCEALLRWVHPDDGLIPPGEFIPIMEDTGMIIPIGRWVIQVACAQVARWQRDRGRPEMTVSVNVSPRQLTDPGLVPCIEEALASSGLATSSLKIEVTETAVVNDLGRAQSTIESIAALGVDLMIDDFGTGYSSLSYLKQLPVSCIKIDRSFITDICVNPADQAIVNAVSELAARLGLSTVAEGVETAEQLAAVRQLGCSLIQGFYYAPALPASEFETAWLTGRAQGSVVP